MSNQPQRPTDDNRDAWNAYWTAQGLPWRTEPEINPERRAYLTERRAVTPDIENGIYPYRDENGSIKLDRADVEWLLATHESARYPANSQKVNLHIRQGLDLRGADLHNVNLGRLPLAFVRGGLDSGAWFDASDEQRDTASVHLEGADLQRADLELAGLRSAHLEGADLRNAFLVGATLRQAHLEGDPLPLPAQKGDKPSRQQIEFPPADLRRAYFDAPTTLDGILLGNVEYGFVRLADVRWGNVNLATINWASVNMLGDERIARQRKAPDGKAKHWANRLDEFEEAVRANRQLASVLRNQGLHEQADRFAYRAQVLQRQVLRRHGIRKWSAYIGSFILDLMAGYGYHPERSFLVYLAAIVWFANAYHLLGGLAPLDASVFSMASFHGRGFFPNESFTLHSPVAILAGVEAFFGLLIEITFIATFTQRFFAR